MALIRRNTFKDFWRSLTAPGRTGQGQTGKSGEPRETDRPRSLIEAKPSSGYVTRRQKCRHGHDWIPLVHPLGDGREELLGIDCDRCGAYYGYRSPFNEHPDAQKLGTVKEST